MTDRFSPKFVIDANCSPAGGEAKPIPPSKSVIRFPEDQYLHKGSPTEWWWHTGTLVAINDPSRVFGFEINASSYEITSSKFIGFTQVSLTDVKNNIHYQQTEVASDSNPNTWAESDPCKPWKVNLGQVSMKTLQGKTWKNMAVMAGLCDKTTNKNVYFCLQLSQDGPPFIEWGTGVSPVPPNPNVKTNNFYYSLTRIEASGVIIIDEKPVEVKGTTWMDHEWGLFAKPGAQWILQDIQLENGICISNYCMNKKLALNTASPSHATVQLPCGETFFVHTTVTPIKRIWSFDGNDYFMVLKVNFSDWHNAEIIVESLMDDQLFRGLEHHSVYEGVARATGIFCGEEVSGQAWIEQVPKDS